MNNKTLNKKDFNFIGGSIIEKQLKEYSKTTLEERSSFAQLQTNIINDMPTKKRQYATDTVKIVQLSLIPFLGTKNLLVKAVANNDGRKYDPQIIFNNVIFEEEDTPTNITFVASDNKKYHIQKISLTNNTVRVRCNCLDFYYRFAPFNAKDKSLVGTPPRPYQKKTDRPPVNPKQVPGVCKHLLKLFSALREAGIVE